jgi:hypothetical protein
MSTRLWPRWPVATPWPWPASAGRSAIDWKVLARRQSPKGKELDSTDTISYCYYFDKSVPILEHHIFTLLNAHAVSLIPTVLCAGNLELICCIA